MSQDTTTIPPRGLWTLKLEDIWKGFIKSCGGLILGLIIKMIQDKFHLPAYDQVEPLLEASAYFFLGYIGINYASNNEGKMFKKDAETIRVPVQQLNELKEQAKTT